MKIQVEKPNKIELEELYHSANWNDAVSFIPSLLRDSWNTFTIRDEKENLVGFAAVYATNQLASLTDVVIHPFFQGKGLGKQLVQLVIQETKKSGFKSLKVDYASDKESFYRKVLT